MKQLYTIGHSIYEKEAFNCHRFGIISKFLTKNEIVANPNKIVSQKSAEWFLELIDIPLNHKFQLADFTDDI